jgi:WD40 repeat protein
MSADIIPRTGLDTDHLNVYIGRINGSIESDPSLAIGSTKELIEATLKTILDGCSLKYDDRKDDIPKLLKKVQEVLKLSPNDIGSSSRDLDTIKKFLHNLGSIAISASELRNIYGTGHGKGKEIQGLTSRHAKLVVATGSALCTFLLETYEYRENIDLAHLKSKLWQLLYLLSFKPATKVRCLSIHPNKNILASGGEDHMLRIWDLDTGKICHEHKRYYDAQSSGDINSLTFSHDGKFIISTGFVSGAGAFQGKKQRKIQILDWEKGEVVDFLSNSSRFDNGHSLALCPNQDTIAFDSINNIDLYNFRDKTHLTILKGHSAQVRAIVFSPNSKILASGCKNGQVRIWDWQTATSVVLDETSKSVNTIVISPNSQLLAIGSDNNQILLFDLINGNKVLELKGHTDSIYSLMFTQDGQFLASSSKDDTVKVWHVKTGQLLHSLEGDSLGQGVLSVSFNRNGNILAAGLAGGGIKVWRQGEPVNNKDSIKRENVLFHDPKCSFIFSSTSSISSLDKVLKRLVTLETLTLLNSSTCALLCWSNPERSRGK